MIFINPPTVLDGRTLETVTHDYAGAEITVRATPDDLSWALMHLGQYVDGSRGDNHFQAYVYSVQNDVSDGGTITILVERP